MILRYISCTILVGLLFTSVGYAIEVGKSPELKFTDIDGKPFDLAEQKGRVVMVTFWTTYCPACKRESPHWVKLYDAYSKKGVTFVGVAEDTKKYAKKVADTAKDRGFVWPIFHERAADGEWLSKQWNIETFSTTVLINPEGKVVWQGLLQDVDKPLANAIRAVKDNEKRMKTGSKPSPDHTG